MMVIDAVFGYMGGVLERNLDLQRIFFAVLSAMSGDELTCFVLVFIFI